MASTLTKNINSKFNPTFMSGYPIYAYGGIPHMYGLGSWLKQNAGTVGMLAGAGIGTAIAPGIGTQIGAQIGGQVGGSAQGGYQQNQQQEQQQNAILEQQKRDLVSNLPAQHYYTPTFQDGGSIHIDPSKRGTFKAQATKMGMGVQEAASKILNAPEGKYSPAMRKKANFAKNFAKANGGLLDSYAGGGTMANLDNTTVYANGGTHESNINGGIPLGQNALVEENEVRFGDYIFSDRIPYKKK